MKNIFSSFNKKINTLQLLRAVKSNDLEKVKSLISKGADVNAFDGLSLKRSIEKNYNEITLELIKNGADLKLLDKTDQPALHKALTYIKDVTIFREVIAITKDINEINKNGQTALYLAIRSEETNKNFISELIIAGADVNIGNPLYDALILAQNNIALELLAAGANPNAQKGDPLLARAIVLHHPKEVILALIKAGANVNVTDYQGNTALFQATTWVGEEAKEIVIALLKAGANPNLPSSNGDFPLIEAILHHKNNIVKELLKAGADPNLHSKDSLLCYQ